MAEPLFTCAACSIPDVLLLTPRHPLDARGSLTKLFHRESFAGLDLPSSFAEVFVSRSAQGVIRGLHLQLPPFAYHKFVCCLDGQVADVLLDVRRGSPWFGRHVMVELSGDAPVLISVPPGVAHGFAALSDAVMFYATTTAHEPSRDGGVRWDSARIRWPFVSPLVSARDHALPALQEFESPFEYSPRAPHEVVGGGGVA